MRMDGGKSQFHPQKPPYMRMDGRKLMGLYWEEGPSVDGGKSQFHPQKPPYMRMDGGKTPVGPQKPA